MSNSTSVDDFSEHETNGRGSRSTRRRGGRGGVGPARGGSLSLRLQRLSISTDSLNSAPQPFGMMHGNSSISLADETVGLQSRSARGRVSARTARGGSIRGKLTQRLQSSAENVMVIANSERRTMPSREDFDKRGGSTQGGARVPARNAPNRKFRDRKPPVETNVTKLETLSDWVKLSSLGNSFRILYKLQDLAPSWTKAFHTNASFEVLDIAFDLFTDIEAEYRFTRTALMKSLFTITFIEKLVLIVDTLKTSWFEEGKGRVANFIEKLRKNLEFVLSSIEDFHEDMPHQTAICSLIEACVRTLDHINDKLKGLQGRGDDDLEKAIVDICKLGDIDFVDKVSLTESPYPYDFRNQLAVMPILTSGPYPSRDHYIKTNFDLLKEDFQSGLRTGVKQYLSDPKKRNFDIWSYEKVRVKRVFPHFEQFERATNERQLLFEVTFPACKKYLTKIKWKSVKRFMLGSLVVLTADEFDSYFLALIEDRCLDDPKSISIVISFIGSPPRSVDFTEFLLVEPKTFYEPYLNAMKVLKSMARIGIPLEKYIVKADTDATLPGYLSPEAVILLGAYKAKAGDGLSWPDAQKLGLNQSQREAFIHALTSEMALIQGPPGTGKTHVAFKIIETLLKNRQRLIDVQRNLSSGPGSKGTVLVVCYKNHALDQILVGLMKKGIRPLRIGGGSKIPALQRELNYKRSPKPVFSLPFFREKEALQSALSNCLSEIQNTLSLINMINDKIGILKEEILREYDIVPVGLDLPLEEWLLENEEVPPLPFDYIERQTAQFFSHESTILRSFESNLFLYGHDVMEYGHTLAEMEGHWEEFDESMMIHFWETNQRYFDAYSRYCYLHYCLNLKVGPSDCPDPSVLAIKGYSELELEERWALYRKWESELVEKLENKVWYLQIKVPEIEELLSKFDELLMSHRLQLANPDVIGVTTSGAAKHYLALADFGPKVVLVEEAAEVLEAHVLASMSAKCEHLILIGDHQQLKPSTASHEIGTRYHLDVSLFERMINNGMKVSTLNTQHRMRPEISALICPTIYENLENHSSVHSFPDVRGMKKNLFFFDHNHLEEVDSDSESKSNPEEGEMVVAIAHYLLKQGYTPDQITILSTYIEQDRLIKKTINNEYAKTGLENVFCTVVDNYQGEENIIILLSLVRSNPNGGIGFLATKNRICVALSRAKHGLFIFGNITCLTKRNSDVWVDIKQTLVGQEAISPKFPLRCERHGNVTEVARPEEVEALKHGGCRNPCGTLLPCGHVCQIMCHARDQHHEEEFACQEICMRKCSNGHTCRALCRKPCPPCPFMMPKILVCGHTKQLECSKDNLQAYCTETVETQLEVCGHIQFVSCKLTAPSERYRIVCRADCKHTFICGHECRKTCHALEDPDHEEFLCDEPCGLINKSCLRMHKCLKKCRESCGDCMVEVEKALSCGHTARMQCGQGTEDYECTERCSRKLSCDHDCVNACVEPCGPCKKMVTKVIPECGHRMKFKCSQPATRSQCKEPCRRVKSCEHQCTGICKEACEDVPCVTKVEVELPCGHAASLSCSEAQKRSYAFTAKCGVPCRAKLPCGHVCKGTCGSCMQGKVHIPCDEKCGRELRCDHTCRAYCASSYHSCANQSCFKTCWGNEVNCLPSSSTRGRGRRSRVDFHPKVHLINRIRWALKEENEKMRKIAQSFNGNKTIAHHIKQVQVFVNKARTNSRNDEELAALETSLFKLEFMSVVLRTMKRLECTKLGASEKGEMKHLLEKLVERSASDRLFGSYEMTQIQEQIVWALLFLDVHDIARLSTADRQAKENMLDLLTKTKSSFERSRRAEIAQKLHNLMEQLNVSNYALTNIELEGTFPAVNQLCSPVLHHRVQE